jgi:hypothetical protein
METAILKDAQKQIHANTFLEKRAEIKTFSTQKKTLNSKILGLRDSGYTEIKGYFSYGCKESIFEDIQETDDLSNKHYLITDNDGLALFFADKQIEQDLKNDFDLKTQFKQTVNSVVKKIKDKFRPKTYEIGILQETLIELLLSNITLKKTAYDSFVEHRQSLKKKNKAEQIQNKIAESKLNAWLTDPARFSNLLYQDSSTEESKLDKMERAFVEYEEIDFLENFFKSTMFPYIHSGNKMIMNDPNDLRDTLFKILDDLFDVPDIETVYKNLLFRIAYCSTKNLYEDTLIDGTLFSNPECFIIELRRKIFLEFHIAMRDIHAVQVPKWTDMDAFYFIINSI